MRRFLKIILIIFLLLPILGLLAIRFLPPLMDPSASDDSMRALFAKTGMPNNHNYDSNGHPLHYVQQGDSLPATIIFVHGSPGNWKGWANFLADTSLTSKANLVAIDRLGFGESARGAPVGSLAEQAGAWAKLLEESQANGKVILVGHSYGGPVVVRMAIDYPQWVDGLVLAAGSISPEMERHEWYNTLAKSKLVSWALPPDMYASNEEIWPLKEELEAMVPYWKNITIPVTVIQGTKDNLVPKENADFAEKMLVNARPLKINKVEGMNHFIPWEHPELITAAVLEQLEGFKDR